MFWNLNDFLNSWSRVEIKRDDNHWEIVYAGTLTKIGLDFIAYHWNISRDWQFRIMVRPKDYDDNQKHFSEAAQIVVRLTNWEKLYLRSILH